MLLPLRTRHGLPSLAAMVLDSGSVIAVGAVGVRAVGRSEAVTSRDPYHLGSCAKPMTATLIALYVDRGALAWEDSMGDVFEADAVHEGFRSATVEQLLAHRSGVTNAWLSGEVWGRLWDRESTPVEHRRRLVGELLGHAPVRSPGSAFEYANANYILAGAALERRSGEAFETLLRRELLDPLEMGSCGFGAPGNAGAVDAPWGHRRAEGVDTPMEPGPDADNPPADSPAGTIHCALEDWGRFAQLHLRAARGEPSLLTTASFRRMHRRLGPDGDNGLGWMIVGEAGTERLTHAGSNGGFRSEITIEPNLDRIVLVATNVNGEGVDRVVAEVTEAVRDWDDARAVRSGGARRTR